jgi:DNA-binding MarR family transcriptional regulator
MSLLNEGRELLEQMIDTAHAAGATEYLIKREKEKYCQNNKKVYNTQTKRG